MALYISSTGCSHNEDFKEGKSKSINSTIFLVDSSLPSNFLSILEHLTLQYDALHFYCDDELLFNSFDNTY